MNAEQASIAILAESPALTKVAQTFAQEMHLPFFYDRQGIDAQYILTFSSNLIYLEEKNRPRRKVYADFLAQQMQYRLRSATLRNEILTRAIGAKPKEQPFILDATGGFAQDSLLLATLGYSVTLLERSRIIFVLLADGLQRARPYLEAVQRISAKCEDAISWLSKNKNVDIIYLDPMFPAKTGSALAKKQMQFFQEVIGQDGDADQLFEAALACAGNRVVVKRPRRADFITQRKASYSLTGNCVRFDVYIK